MNEALASFIEYNLLEIDSVYLAKLTIEDS